MNELTYTDLGLAFVATIALSVVLLRLIDAARALLRRGRQYVTVQDVDDGRAFGGDYEE